jgi:hypothetical protein
LGTLETEFLYSDSDPDSDPGSESMALLYTPKETLRTNYIYCPNCFRRLPDPQECENLNHFALLYPRSGEGVDLESQCFRILGTMKKVKVSPGRIEFLLNATPSLPESEWLAYEITLEAVDGINAGLDRGGDVVAKISSKGLNCKTEYYDFYYFGTWNQIPSVVWADTYMEMSALYSQMIRKKQ